MDYTKYCSLNYNGKLLDQLIPGYITTNVSGRDLFVADVETVKVPGRDGEVVLSSQYPVRTIPVEFVVRGMNNKNKRAILLSLNTAIYTDGKDVEIRFGDESGVRYGRVTSVQEPPADYFQGVGKLIITCYDPFLYSEIKTSTGIISSSYPYPVKLESIKLTTSASATKLIIKNETKGVSIILNGSFAAGDVVIVTKENITKNGQNITSWLDFTMSDYQEFKAYNGDKISSSVAGMLSIQYRERIS